LSRARRDARFAPPIYTERSARVDLVLGAERGGRRGRKRRATGARCGALTELEPDESRALTPLPDALEQAENRRRFRRANRARTSRSPSLATAAPTCLSRRVGARAGSGCGRDARKLSLLRGAMPHVSLRKIPPARDRRPIPRCNDELSRVVEVTRWSSHGPPGGRQRAALLPAAAERLRASPPPPELRSSDARREARWRGRR